MTREQWDRLKIVFQEAIDQPPEVRRAWLLEECRGEVALQREIESLLAAHESLDDFLETAPQVDPGDIGTLPAGTQIGAYRILGEIGHGGMGVVYLAVDTRLGRQVALKSLPASVAAQPELRERLRREARAAATISHPSVATVYALEEIDDNVFMASEYVKGDTLRSLIQRGPVAPDRAQKIASDIASALAAAHEAGVIHRDLKPENVLVTPSGVVKVVDFGIAKIAGADEARLTRTGSAVGTLAYMAPEQLTGGVVDARVDIYAWGLVASEMLDGQHPFKGRASFDPPVVRPSTNVSHSPLAALIQQSLQAEAEQRPTSGELLLALNRLAPTASGSTAMRPAPTRPPRWWWEFHQGMTAAAYWAMTVPAWYARGRIGGSLGTGFFLVLLAAIIVATVLRLHLWFTARHIEEEFEVVRRRSSRWIHAADWVFAAVLVGGGLAVGDERSPLTFVLPSVAIGAVVSFLVIEPVTMRAAFGDRPKS